MMDEYIIFKTENPRFTYPECMFHAILIIKRIYRTVFVTQTQCVLCELGNKFLNITYDW
jgi:hypothetical protein